MGGVTAATLHRVVVRGWFVDGTSGARVLGPASSPVLQWSATPGVSHQVVYRVAETHWRTHPSGLGSNYAHGPQSSAPDFLSAHAAGSLLAVTAFVMQQLVQLRSHGGRPIPPELDRYCVRREDAPWAPYASCDAPEALVADERQYALAVTTRAPRDVDRVARSYTEGYRCVCASFGDICMGRRDHSNCTWGVTHAWHGRRIPWCACDLNASLRAVGRMEYFSDVRGDAKTTEDGRPVCVVQPGTVHQGWWYSFPAEAECSPVAWDDARRPGLIGGGGAGRSGERSGSKGGDGGGGSGDGSGDGGGCTWAREATQHLTNGARLMASDELGDNAARWAAMSDDERNLASYDFTREAELLQAIVDAPAEVQRCCGC